MIHERIKSVANKLSSQGHETLASRLIQLAQSLSRDPFLSRMSASVVKDESPDKIAEKIKQHKQLVEENIKRIETTGKGAFADDVLAVAKRLLQLAHKHGLDVKDYEASVKKLQDSQAVPQQLDKIERMLLKVVRNDKELTSPKGAELLDRVKKVLEKNPSDKRFESIKNVYEYVLQKLHSLQGVGQK